MTDAIVLLAQKHYQEAPKDLPFILSDVWEEHRQTMAELIPTYSRIEEVILRAQAGLGFDHRITFNPVLIQAKLEALRSRFPDMQIPSESSLSRPESIRHLDGKLISNIFIWHLEAYLTCVTILPRPQSVLEIGGGYGGLARIFALKGIDYTITDLPESLFFAEVFLRSNGIENVQLIPAGQPLGHYDMAINQGSFGEMPQGMVDYWAEALRGKAKHVYSLNYLEGIGPNGTGAVFRGWKVVKEEINPPPIMGDVQGIWHEVIYA